MPTATRKSTKHPPAEPNEHTGPMLVEPTRKPPSLRHAIAEARREVALTLPLVMRTLAKESIEGSVNHLKLYLELSGILKGGLAAPLKQVREVRERTLEEVLLEQWERDKAEDSAECEQLQAARQQAQRNRERAEKLLSGQEVLHGL